MSSSSPRDPSSLRGKLIEKIAQSLAPSAGGASDATKDTATAIEMAVVNKFGAATKEYTAKGRSLIFNLGKNADLRAHILDGSLSAEWLVSAQVADLATDALKLARAESQERFYAQRSLGQSDERVVGWNAGTAGKLEWSHKYEKEKPAATATPSAGVTSAPIDEDQPATTTEDDIGWVGKEAGTSSGLGGGGADAESDLDDDAGMDDVEADDLKPAEDSTSEGSASEIEDDDSDSCVASDDQGLGAPSNLGTKRGWDDGGLDGAGDATASASKQPRLMITPHVADGTLPPVGAPSPLITTATSYTHAQVRQCTLQQAIARASINLAMEETASALQVAEAVERVRGIVEAVHNEEVGKA